jgi:hypothetical protein
MGGDPKAAERRADQDKNLKLRNEAMEARAKERAAKAAADAAKANRAPGPPISRDLPAGAPDWRTDLQNWAKWRDGGHDAFPRNWNVPGYLEEAEGRSGDAINEARKNLISFLEGEDGWDKPKGRWTTRQRKIFDDEAKRLKNYGTNLERKAQVGGGQPLEAERAGDRFYWVVDGRGREGTLEDVVNGRTFTDAEVINMMVEDGETKEDATEAVKNARKANVVRKSRPSRATVNAYASLHRFRGVDLSGPWDIVKDRIDPNLRKYLTKSGQDKIRASMDHLQGADASEEVDQELLQVVRDIGRLNVSGIGKL